jgi:hypothetical protein
MSVLEFSWLDDNAATGGAGAVLCDLGDESEGDADAVEFVIVRGGTRNGVGTAAFAFAFAAAVVVVVVDIDEAGSCGCRCGRCGGSSFRGFENLSRGACFDLGKGGGIIWHVEDLGVGSEECRTR